MKKISKIFTTLALVVALAITCFAFTACGETPAKVAETYSTDISYFDMEAQEQFVQMMGHTALTLNDDGTYVLVETSQVYAQHNSGGHCTFTVFGTYTKAAEDAEDPENTIYIVTLEKATRVIWNDAPAWSNPKYVDTDDTSTYLDGITTFDAQVAACKATSVWGGQVHAYGGKVTVDKSCGKITGTEYTAAPEAE